MLFNLQNSYASSKKIIFSPGGQKQCTSGPQIWCKKSNLSFFIPNVFSKDVSEQTKGNKN